jgi:hypothetical protein
VLYALEFYYIYTVLYALYTLEFYFNNAFSLALTMFWTLFLSTFLSLKKTFLGALTFRPFKTPERFMLDAVHSEGVFDT